MIEEVLSLRPGSRMVVGDDGSVTLTIGLGEVPLGVRPPGAMRALTRLSNGSCTEEDLIDDVIDADGEGALMGFQLLIRRLESSGLITKTLLADGQRLLSLIPVGYRRIVPHHLPDKGADVVLSRFATMRAEEGSVVLETPRSTVKVVLHDPRMVTLVSAAARPGSIENLASNAQSGGLEREATHEIIACLTRTGMIIEAAASGGTPGSEGAGIVESEETANLRLAQWSPVDLAFHHRTRLGRHSEGYGGTYRFAGKFDPVPTQRGTDHAESGPRDISFDPVDLEIAAKNDPPLTTVIESRRSIRDHDDSQPLTDVQLGEFLFRTMRVRRPLRDEYEDLLDRPVPAGGALHEIDAYIAVRLCGGIEPGLYRYDPFAHRLVFVSDDVAGVTRMMGGVPLNPVTGALPQVLIVAAVRFGRVMWKYESMSYALILKNLGVIYQSMYLVATAMGLAPCALGGGDSEAFCALAGVDPDEESSVGEFALGSVAPQ